MKIKTAIIVILIVCVAFFFLKQVDAELSSSGNYVVNDTIRIKQVCNDATYINISSIAFPNSTTAVLNIPMISIGSGEYAYNFTNTSSKGRYYVNGISDGCDKVFSFFFDVSSLGEEYNTQTAIAYFGALCFLLLIILIVVFVIFKLPSSDSVDDRNEIIQISQLKHFRLVGWIIVYTLLLSMVFIIANFYLAYFNNIFLGKFFFTIYQIMFYGLLIAVPMAFIYLIWRFYKDKEFQNMINRGVGIHQI